MNLSICARRRKQNNDDCSFIRIVTRQRYFHEHDFTFTIWFDLIIKWRKQRKHKCRVKIDLSFKARLKKEKTINMIIKYYVLSVHCQCAINNATKHLRRNWCKLLLHQLIIINQIEIKFQKFLFRRSIHEIETHVIYFYYEQHLHQHTKHK